jgi:hypothetical protein
VTDLGDAHGEYRPEERWGRVGDLAYFRGPTRPLDGARDRQMGKWSMVRPVNALLRSPGWGVRRRRASNPVRPFDATPPQVVEAAKRIFAALRGHVSGRP